MFGGLNLRGGTFGFGVASFLKLSRRWGLSKHTYSPDKPHN